MSFFVFVLIYAVAAIALVMVIGFIVREFRRKRARQSPLPRSQSESGQSEKRRLKLPSLTKKAPPESEPEAPPPPRKRQLSTFAEAEADAAETPGPAEMPGAADGDYVKAVLARLEQTFDRLQAGEITLDAYRADVLAERAAIDQRIAALSSDGGEADLLAAREAQASARWCLEWADEQARTLE